MALTTNVLALTVNTNSGTKTATATPSLNDLVVLLTMHTGNTSATAPTDDNGGTYSQIGSAVKNTSADTVRAWVRDQAFSPSVSTIFSHAPGTTTGGGIAVGRVSGVSKWGAAAIRQFAKQDNQASGTAAPVFGAAALTENAIFGIIFNGANPAGITEPTGYTEANDTGYATPTTGVEIVRRSSGETNTTITWGSSSASAFCSAVFEVDSSASLLASLFTNTNAFYAPTVTPGDVGLAPSLYSNSNSFYSASASPGAVNLAPSLFSSSGAFYSPTVAAGAVTLTPSLLTDGDTFYAPSVSPGSVTLTPGAFANSTSFYAATVAPGAVLLLPPLVADGNVFYSPAIAATVTLSPPLFANDNSFFAAAVGAAIDQELLPIRLDNVVSFYGAIIRGQNRNTALRDNGERQPLRPRSPHYARPAAISTGRR